MNEFKIGDMVKVKGENNVFVVSSIASGLQYAAMQGYSTIPVGWLLNSRGGSIDPDKCELYKGATSVFDRSDDE